MCAPGDSNIGWSGRPLLAPRPKKPDPPASPTRTSSGHLSGKSIDIGVPNLRPVVWTRYYTPTACSSVMLLLPQAVVLSLSSRIISPVTTMQCTLLFAHMLIYTGSAGCHSPVRLPPFSNAEQGPAAHQSPYANVAVECSSRLYVASQ